MIVIIIWNNKSWKRRNRGMNKNRRRRNRSKLRKQLKQLFFMKDSKEKSNIWKIAGRKEEDNYKVKKTGNGIKHWIVCWSHLEIHWNQYLRNTVSHLKVIPCFWTLPTLHFLLHLKHFLWVAVYFMSKVKPWPCCSVGSICSPFSIIDLDESWSCHR